MKRHTLQVGSFEVNCSLLYADNHTWIIDPGAEAERIIAQLEQDGRIPDAILLTHAHFDHIGGVPSLQQRFPALPVYVHPNDVPAFTHPLNQMPPDYPPIDRPANVRDARTFTGAEVIETPGHTPGGVCYLFKGENLLCSGDTLFAGSIGRTDLPGGDMLTLMSSLEKLKELPPATTVIPGHGPYTTIGHELAGNPFLQ